MSRFAAVAGGLLLVFTAVFLAVEARGVPLLTDPSDRLHHGGVAAALLGLGLLIVDVVVPVPSSVVMVALGAAFGFVGGALLSLAGSVAAAMVGFAIGRRGEGLVARLVPADERRRADRFLERWGLVAIIVTRPVPLLAETVVILAGTSSIRAGRVALAAAVGALPMAVVAAAAGSWSAREASPLLVLALVGASAVTFVVVRGIRGPLRQPAGELCRRSASDQPPGVAANARSADSDGPKK